MLIIKKRNIQKGFSLIELIVAVVILAIATLGIYQAYSVSFTGMADARDRTVATNYVRQAMEGIKNMDFDKIITQSRSYITGSKHEYEREVIVQESTNLKKVTTKVYWRNRNGNKKMVENGMSVHFMQTSEGTATRIMLIANPYNVLTEGTSTITAVAKDDKGNTVTIWTGDISFSIDSANSTSSGTFSDYSGVDNGISSIIFTASDNEGKVVIIASDSASGLTPDSVNIKVTEPKKPVKINLTENPTYMTADTSSTSKITATIVDAGGETVTEITNVITFSVSGPGTLSAVTSTATTNGIATITLTSNGTPGTITVTVSATGLEPGIVDVITGGKISISASRFSVPINETSEVTVTTKDVDGVPIKYVGTINLEISPNPDGAGIFENDLNTIEIYFNGSTSSSNPITFTGISVGIVNINAEDQEGILDEGSIELTITPALVPDHIAVTANPSIIKAGGTGTSTITARVKTEDNITVISYTQPITFMITEGEGSFSYFDTRFKDGEATAILYPPENAGTATIEVFSTYNNTTIHGSTKVKFCTEAHHIILSADPQKISVNGKRCTVLAKIVDEKGTLISDYNKDITFEILTGFQEDTIKFQTAPNTNSLTKSVKDGISTVKLKSGNVAGTAVITARSYTGTKSISGTLNIPVGITLILVENSVNYPDNTVSFDINVQGADLLLEEIKVSWSPNGSETLNKIDIGVATIYNNDPDNRVGSTVYTDDSDRRVADVNVTDITLSTEISTIIMYFNTNMVGITTLDVTFNPNSGDYLVNLK